MSAKDTTPAGDDEAVEALMEICADFREWRDVSASEECKREARAILAAIRDGRVPLPYDIIKDIGDKWLASKVCCDGTDCGCRGMTVLSEIVASEKCAEIDTLRARCEAAEKELEQAWHNERMRAGERDCALSALAQAERNIDHERAERDAAIASAEKAEVERDALRSQLHDGHRWTKIRDERDSAIARAEKVEAEHRVTVEMLNRSIKSEGDLIESQRACKARVAELERERKELRNECASMCAQIDAIKNNKDERRTIQSCKVGHLFVAQSHEYICPSCERDAAIARAEALQARVGELEKKLSTPAGMELTYVYDSETVIRKDILATERAERDAAQAEVAILRKELENARKV